MKICACVKVMTFFRDRSKKFRKLLQIEKKTINFLYLKSDDHFFGGVGENTYDPDWQMFWDIIRHANLGECKSNFLHEPPILAWAPPLSAGWRPSHTCILQAYFINIICPIIRNLVD